MKCIIDEVQGRAIGVMYLVKCIIGEVQGKAILVDVSSEGYHR